MHFLFLFCLTSILLVFFIPTYSEQKNHLTKAIDQYKDIIGGAVQQIENLGYPVENHEVQTQDGFILTVQRIRHNKLASGKPLVLLPGLSCSAMIYVRWSNSIAPFLADQGYDVWLGNSRGDLRYSKHIRYTVHDSEFWNFSWEELGYYDTSATIDYVLNNTNYNQLILVSYSIATIASLALLSVNPEYNDKVATHVTLAPMTTIPYQAKDIFTLGTGGRHMTSDLEVCITEAWYDAIIDKGKATHLVVNKKTMAIAPAICLTFGYSICKFAMGLFLGYSPGSYDENVGMIMYDLTSGVSFKTFLHLTQQIKFKEMRRYSYGEDENIKRYGSKLPPAFNLSQASSPTVLISGISDPGSHPLDAELLFRKMTNAKKVTLNITMFTHADFVWSTNPTIRDYINHVILENINTVNLNPNNN